VYVAFARAGYRSLGKRGFDLGGSPDADAEFAESRGVLPDSPGWRCIFAHEEPTSGNPKSIISPIVGYKANPFGLILIMLLMNRPGLAQSSSRNTFLKVYVPTVSATLRWDQPSSDDPPITRVRIPETMK
jgi:hypothetical protein